MADYAYKAKDQERALDRVVSIYLPLIHEIDIRIVLINRAIKGDLEFENPYIREFCYFQFRRICEIISASTLLLCWRSDNLSSKKYQREYSARRIMDAITRIYPNAFPRPSIITNLDGKQKLDINRDAPALTNEEFNNLYAKCGEVLHRGSISKIEAESEFPQQEYDETVEFLKKIVHLVSNFRIEIDNQLFIIYAKTDNGLPVLERYTTFPDRTMEVAKYPMALISPEESLPVGSSLIERRLPYMTTRDS